MLNVQGQDLLNQVPLRVVEYLHVEIPQQIEIHLVTVVPDAHDARAVLIQQVDLIAERLSVEIRE